MRANRLLALWRFRRMRALLRILKCLDSEAALLGTTSVQQMSWSLRCSFRNSLDSLLRTGALTGVGHGSAR